MHIVSDKGPLLAISEDTCTCSNILHIAKMTRTHPKTSCETHKITPGWLRDNTPGRYLRGTEIFSVSNHLVYTRWQDFIKNNFRNSPLPSLICTNILLWRSEDLVGWCRDPRVLLILEWASWQFEQRMARGKSHSTRAYIEELKLVFPLLFAGVRHVTFKQTVFIGKKN